MKDLLSIELTNNPLDLERAVVVQLMATRVPVGDRLAVGGEFFPLLFRRLEDLVLGLCTK